MFVGHYGPAALAGGRVKLWHGFLAVQFLDLLWAPFVLIGLEHVRIVENFTASNHFDLYHMPYTHSLVMAVFWSAVAGFAFQYWRKGGGIIIGALVFSHWGLDFITHKSDLALWFGGPKVGLGLWDYRAFAVGAELALLIGGLGWYLGITRSKGVAGVITPYFLLIALVGGQIYGNFGPPPESANAASMAALVSYVLFAAMAAAVDMTRTPPRPKPRPS